MTGVCAFSMNQRLQVRNATPAPARVVVAGALDLRFLLKGSPQIVLEDTRGVFSADVADGEHLLWLSPTATASLMAERHKTHSLCCDPLFKFEPLTCLKFDSICQVLQRISRT